MRVAQLPKLPFRLGPCEQQQPYWESGAFGNGNGFPLNRTAHRMGKAHGRIVLWSWSPTRPSSHHKVLFSTDSVLACRGPPRQPQCTRPVPS